MRYTDRVIKNPYS